MYEIILGRESAVPEKLKNIGLWNLTSKLFVSEIFSVVLFRSSSRQLTGISSSSLAHVFKLWSVVKYSIIQSYGDIVRRCTALLCNVTEIKICFHAKTLITVEPMTWFLKVAHSLYSEIKRNLSHFFTLYRTRDSIKSTISFVYLRSSTSSSLPILIFLFSLSYILLFFLSAFSFFSLSSFLGLPLHLFLTFSFIVLLCLDSYSCVLRVWKS
jgi:hypothetical protein